LKQTVLLELIEKKFIREKDWIDTKRVGISWTWNELNYLGNHLHDYVGKKKSIVYQILKNCNHPSIILEVLRRNHKNSFKVEYLHEVIRIHNNYYRDISYTLPQDSINRIIDWLCGKFTFTDMKIAQQFVVLCVQFKVFSASYEQALILLLNSQYINCRNHALQCLLKDDHPMSDTLKKAIYHGDVEYTFTPEYELISYMRLHHGEHILRESDVHPSFYKEQFEEMKTKSTIKFSRGKIVCPENLSYLSAGKYRIDELIESIDWEFFIVHKV